MSSKALSNKVAPKYCPNNLAMYSSLVLGQTPSRKPMCPPRAVTMIATWLDSSAARVGIAKHRIKINKMY